MLSDYPLYKLDNLIKININEQIEKINQYMFITSAYIIGEIIIINFSSSGTGSANYLEKLFTLNIGRNMKPAAAVLRDSTGNNTASIFIEDGKNIKWRSSTLNWNSGSLMGVMVGVLS